MASRLGVSAFLQNWHGLATWLQVVACICFLTFKYLGMLKPHLALSIALPGHEISAVALQLCVCRLGLSQELKLKQKQGEMQWRVHCSYLDLLVEFQTTFFMYPDVSIQ